MSGFVCLAITAVVAGLSAGAQQPVLPSPPAASNSFLNVVPRSSKLVERETVRKSSALPLSHDQKLALVRQHIKHVFVLFQENRSFDFYFAGYPGADGLYSQPPAQTPGFEQPIVNVDGTVGTVRAFRIPQTITDKNGKSVPLYPADIASVNHSHVPSVNKLNLDANNIARNDRYALVEEGVTLDASGKPNKLPTLARKQMAELVMSHVDCDTAPFLWQYADRFTLFDHFMDTVIGPSGPNAVAIIAGQSGATEWMLHPELADTADLPMTGNPQPFYDKLLGPGGADFRDSKSKPEVTLTFATLPLSFLGRTVQQTTAADRDAAHDLLDVREDIAKIAGLGLPPVNWAWYQQGYGHEPTDKGEAASHDGYIAHHNGPQYFGYIANNPQIAGHMRGLQEFFDDVQARRLPDAGVFYVRGGYGNIRNLHTQDPNPRVNAVMNGNDDHPGYADTQVSEALLAEEVNAIAASPYWKDSAILIAYDETDGLYDHVPPVIRARDPKGFAMNQGPRIPFLLLSPFAVAHGVSHEPSEHSSVIKMVDELFGLIPLADLPEEERGRQLGEKSGHGKDLGPADDKTANVGDLLSGFDDDRLRGRRKPLTGEYASIPAAEVMQLPHYGGEGCKRLEITPLDWKLTNPIPDDFNPRPDTTPGIPRDGNWTP